MVPVKGLEVQAHHPTILDMNCLVLWPLWPPRTIKCDNNNNNNTNDNDMISREVVLILAVYSVRLDDMPVSTTYMPNDWHLLRAGSSSDTDQSKRVNIPYIGRLQNTCVRPHQNSPAAKI
jgi:hypothetical protein